MPNRTPVGDTNVKAAELMTGYVATWKDEMVDAVITAAALVARADNWIDTAERRQLLEFLDRNNLMPVTRFEAREAFERRIRELREPGGAVTAVSRLARCRGSSLAHLAIEAGEAIAAADHYLDPREMRMIDLIRRTVQAQSVVAIEGRVSG